MARLQLIPSAEAHVEEAGLLLDARHRAHRRAQPLLAARFEEPGVARAEVEALWPRGFRPTFLRLFRCM